MKHFIYLSLLVIGARSFYIDDEPTEKDKIIGGKIAAIKKLPYQGQLIAQGVMKCGVSIISDYWLVTAAHCSLGTQFLLPRKVLTGTRFNRRGGTMHEIDYIVDHPDYDTFTFENDIALIKLKKPIVFDDTQQPIKLTDRRVKEADRVLISGFGHTVNNGGRTSSHLLKATVYATNLESCRKIYLQTEDDITPNMFCAWAFAKDSCQGDSGGPAVVNGKLAGIVSFGDDCGSPIFPGVYTQLFNYLPWIARVMAEKEHGFELWSSVNVHKDPEIEETPEIDETPESPESLKSLESPESPESPEIPESPESSSSSSLTDNSGKKEEEYIDEDDVVEEYYDDLPPYVLPPKKKNETKEPTSYLKKFLSLLNSRIVKNSH